MTAADRGWTSSTWATYKAWQRHGNQVRRGERGTQVVLWKPTERSESTDDGDATIRRSLIARAFTVFAAEQVEGANRYTTTPNETMAKDRRIAEADTTGSGDRVGAELVN